MPRQRTNYFRDTYDFLGDFSHRHRPWKAGGGQCRSMLMPASHWVVPDQPDGKEPLP